MFLAFTTIKERSTPDSRPHEYKGRPRVKEGEIGVDERERAWKYDGNKGGGDSGRFDLRAVLSRGPFRPYSSKAWLLRAERFKGLAYFRSISLFLSPPSSGNRIFSTAFLHSFSSSFFSSSR